MGKQKNIVNSILNTENSFHTKNSSCYCRTALILGTWRNYLVFVLTQSFQEGKGCSSQLAFLAQLISIPIFSLSIGELFSVPLKCTLDFCWCYHTIAGPWTIQTKEREKNYYKSLERERKGVNRQRALYREASQMVFSQKK